MRNTTIGLSIALLSMTAAAEVVDFRVDPMTIDTNMDGFITDSEMTLTGSDGVIWAFMPTNNLVGADRFLVSDTHGLHFGGGGGSTLSFEFTVDTDVTLLSYTIGDQGFILGNPTFQLLDDGDLLSDDNDADMIGTSPWESGPIDLTAGTVYTIDVTTTGAAIQSFFHTWEYRPVPTPSALALLGLGGLVAAGRRR